MVSAVLIASRSVLTRFAARLTSHDLIAIAAVCTLALWLGLFLSDRGGQSAALGWLDPSTRLGGPPLSVADVPLAVMLVLGGMPLVFGLLQDLFNGRFGADLLAGISIVTSVLLGEYLAGVLVVLMLSGGEALESRAVRRAGDVLEALARRMPTVAHRKTSTGLTDLPLAELTVGDVITVLPHEICPVDGTVVAGHGSMDESYLTGEPYHMAKAPGSAVLSGAINGQAVLEIRSDRVGSDSRYAKIMQVLAESQQTKPKLRRMADILGGLYTPLAVAIAAAAWWASGSPTRFLAVLVVATPCPLLIGIPVALIGAISLAARRGIVIRDPAIIERLDTCRIAIFDKTGTLTYGSPQVTDVIPCGDHDANDVLTAAAGLEAYSKHPLAAAVLEAASSRGLTGCTVEAVAEKPGAGLTGRVAWGSGTASRRVSITSRKKLADTAPDEAAGLPPTAGGLECVVLFDDRLAGVLRFRDTPRPDGKLFVQHLAPDHKLERVMIVSGDRESEVRWLAESVGIKEIHASIQPEGKLRLVEEATASAPTLFVGDGINDAPALAAATVGVAMGAASDVTSEASGAVIMGTSLERVDELLHIGRRFRSIALQTAIGGMAMSLIGMAFAAAGYLPPAAGAMVQEAIDLVAVANALRVSWRPGSLSDYAG